MKLKFLLIILLTFNLIYAQKPILKGKINLSVSNKTFQADLKLVSIPENLKSFQLILNKKFHRVKFYDGNDLKPDTITFDPAVSDEGYLYHFKNYQSNTLGVRFSYKERNSNDSSDDWMGNIAFNDNKLRISEQSAWFPTLYDSINDIYYNDIPYDLEIECPDCKSIYINGQDPRKTTKTFVTSNNKPYELMLFAGDFDFERLDDNYIINSNLTKKDKKVIGKTIDSIKRYYGSKTNIEYNSAVNLIHTTAKDEKSEFLFVSYPTITQVGNLELNYFFNSKNYKKFLFHEFAHYYFGKIFSPNTSLRIFINEAFSEYMAMKYYEKEFGDLDYKKWVSEKIKSLNIINHNPISEIQSLENYKPSISSYAYNYGTLVLLAVEQKIGEENMWNWIKGLLNSNSLKTDYNFLIDSLSTHTDKKTLDALRRDIFQNKNSELYIKAYLKKRATTKN